jgi:hypothetical protein
MLFTFFVMLSKTLSIKVPARLRREIFFLAIHAGIKYPD